MTAKYPSIRRRVPASLLTLSFLLMLPGQAAAEEADSAAIDEAAAGAAVAAGQADDEVSRGDIIIVTARRRQETAQEVPVAISVRQTLPSIVCAMNSPDGFHVNAELIG